jgi:hypothetical protein
VNEFSDAINADRFSHLIKTVGLAVFGIYITIKMKRISFLNRLFFGSSKNKQNFFAIFEHKI